MRIFKRKKKVVQNHNHERSMKLANVDFCSIIPIKATLEDEADKEQMKKDAKKKRNSE